MSMYNNSANDFNRNRKVTSTAVSYSILQDDDIIEVTDTTAARTITLPAPATVGANTSIGKTYTVKDKSGSAGVPNIITITPSSGTIDGLTSAYISYPYGVLQIYSDGTNYFTAIRQSGNVLVSRQTASNVANISFLGLANYPYNSYLLVYTNARNAGSQSLRMTVSTNNGSSFVTTGYRSFCYFFPASGGAGGSVNAVTTNFVISTLTSAAATDSVDASIYIYNINNAVATFVAGSGVLIGGAETYTNQCAGSCGTTSVNALNLFMSSGNITAGSFSLYGLV